MNSHFQYLIIPGLAGSGINHWQSIWESRYTGKFKRVEQDNWDWPEKDIWVNRLQEYIVKLEKPVILVAHSLGCLTAVHWAAQYQSPWVAGAMLVAPADAALSKRLSFVKGFTPIPSQKLPFKSVLVASTNDMYASLSRSENFARVWGSEFINIGEKGHINAMSGLGGWEEGIHILKNLPRESKIHVEP